MNNKLNYMILLAVFFSVFQLKAQSDSCATEPLDSASFEDQPWFGNNDYLLDLLDSLGYWEGQNSMYNTLPVEGGFDAEAKYWIPIKAWVYRRDDGSGGTKFTKPKHLLKFVSTNK